MKLVAHEAFRFNDKNIARGDVIEGDDADAIAENPILMRKCSKPHDAAFQQPAAPPAPFQRPTPTPE